MSHSVEVIDVRRASHLPEHACGHMRGFAGSGTLTIQGWVVGHVSEAIKVELVDEDGESIAEAPVDERRPDIAKAFSDKPGALTSGFRVMLRPQGGGDSQIHVQVVFVDGARASLGVIRSRVSRREVPSSEQGGVKKVSYNGRPTWSSVVGGREGKVLFGVEGWLYLRRDSNDILGQQTGRVKLGEDQRLKWRAVLEQRVEISDRLGVTWSCLVAPDKESLYPEYLPPEIRPAERRPIHEFLEIAAGVDAPVKYAFDDLLSAKTEAELYARTDTHWNYRGAYIAYRAFCRDLQERGVRLKAVDEASIRWTEHIIQGDLGSKVQPIPRTGPMIRAHLEDPRGRLVFDNEIKNHGRVMRFEQDGDAGLTCVFFGESFATYLLMFLKETFQRVIFVHTSMFIAEILERECPDVVLSLPLERFLIRVPDDRDSLARFHSVVLRKGGELPWAVEST